MDIQWFLENYDKWLHLLISGMLSLWMLILANTKSKVWIGFTICLLIAAGKELFYDMYLGKGNPEFLDFVYTIILPIIVLIIKSKKHELFKES